MIIRKLSYTSIDLSKPHLWYEDARKLKRLVVCHIGPTNSGKTYNALQALMSAPTGLYCGPLRLLAWEVSTKLREKGIQCSLITGNEIDRIDKSTHISSTIEMADIKQYFDVVVIDEMQLVGDYHRGWAWTKAFLGLQCNQIHLCGSSTMIPIVEKLCLETNDELIIKSYDRLSKLTVSKRAIISYKNIKPGDCIVAFDRRALYKIKRIIESYSNKNKCCVIYGSLPPITRKDQAQLFSDPNSTFNFLVSTDAIGMGLNLSIKRIIFSEMTKFDGFKRRPLTSSEIKQIAGRAGRYQSIYENGEVTCLHEEDMNHLNQSMLQKDKSIHKAGIFPSFEQLEYLAFINISQANNDVIQDFLSYYFNKISSTSYEQDGETLSKHRNIINIITDNFKSMSKFVEEFYNFLTDPIDMYLSQNLFDRSKYRIISKNLFDNSLSFKSNEINHSFTWIPDISLTSLLQLYIEQSTLTNNKQSNYFLCNLDAYIYLSNLVDNIPSLPLYDKYTICKAPINIDNQKIVNNFRGYIIKLSEEKLIYCNIPSNIVTKRSIKPSDILRLEELHQMVDCYIWLAYRYPANFIDLNKAMLLSNELSININEALLLLNINIKKNNKDKVKNRDYLNIKEFNDFESEYTNEENLLDDDNLSKHDIEYDGIDNVNHLK